MATPTQTLLVVGNQIPTSYATKYQKQAMCMAPAFLQHFVNKVPDTIRVIIVYGSIGSPADRIVSELIATRLLTSRSAETEIMLDEITSSYRSFQPGISMETVRSASKHAMGSKKQ